MEKDVGVSTSRLYFDNFLSLENIVSICDLLLKSDFVVNLEIYGKYCKDIEEFTVFFHKKRPKSFALYFSQNTKTPLSLIDGSLIFLSRRMRLFINQSTLEAKKLEGKIEEIMRQGFLKPRILFSFLGYGVFSVLFVAPLFLLNLLPSPWQEVFYLTSLVSLNLWIFMVIWSVYYFVFLAPFCKRAKEFKRRKKNPLYVLAFVTFIFWVSYIACAFYYNFGG